MGHWHVTANGPSEYYEAAVALTLLSAYWSVIARVWRYLVATDELIALHRETRVPTNVGFLIS